MRLPLNFITAEKSHSSIYRQSAEVRQLFRYDAEVAAFPLVGLLSKLTCSQKLKYGQLAKRGKPIL